MFRVSAVIHLIWFPLLVKLMPLSVSYMIYSWLSSYADDVFYKRTLDLSVWFRIGPNVDSSESWRDALFNG